MRASFLLPVATILAVSVAARADTFTVTSLADPGTGGCTVAECTLREAIQAANDEDGIDVDVIDVEGFGAGHRFEPLTPLPPIIGPVIIDAESGENPMIDGKKISGDARGLVLAAGSSGSRIENIAVVGFQIGIWVGSDDNTIDGCNVGVESDGMTRNGNEIGLYLGGHSNKVTNSIVSGNDLEGILVDGATDIEVTGSTIGLGKDGMTARGNGSGIGISDSSNVVIGAPGEGNVISGNEGDGVYSSNGGGDHVIQNNLIGVNAGGGGAAGNQGHGVAVAGSTIRNNVISCNTKDGVHVAGGHGAVIERNRIGTDEGGGAYCPNENGIWIEDAESTLIGGDGLADGNVIAGHLAGRGIHATGAKKTTIRANVIGLSPDESGTMPNQDGIFLVNATDSLIRENVIAGNSAESIRISAGSLTTIEGNLIGVNHAGTVFNGGGARIYATDNALNVTIEDNVISAKSTGVLVNGDTKGVTITDNVIKNGSAIGIDLFPPSGRTANDPGDADTGANDLQNFPELLTAVTTSGGNTIIRGRLHSRPNTLYLVALHEDWADGECSNTPQPAATVPAGAFVTTNAQGDATFDTGPFGGIYAGKRLTATATAHGGGTGTSEPSPCLLVEPCPEITVGPATLPGGPSGAPYSQQLTASGTGRPVTFAKSLGTLPPGLTVSADGVLAGTPTLDGSYFFQVTATDEAGCPSTPRSYTVVIGGCTAITLIPDALPAGTRGTIYSQTLDAAGGTGTKTFAVTGGVLPAGLSLSAAGALMGTPTSPGVSTVTVTATDEEGCTGSRPYPITIQCPTLAVSPGSLPAGRVGAAYDQPVSATGATSFAITGGELPPGLALAKGRIAGTATMTGSFTFTVTATDAQSCTGSQTYAIDVACPSIAVGPAAVGAATAGQSYQQGFSASQGSAPYTFEVTEGALPAGLALSMGGALSGTPTTTGTARFTVRATDGYGCAGARAYDLVTQCPAIDVRPTTLAPASTQASYGQMLSARGAVGSATFDVVAGALPSGMGLSGTGGLTGTPIAQGSFDVTIRARDANMCAGTRAYTLSVTSCPSIVLAPTELPDGELGETFAAAITAAGGRAPYTYAASGGDLPDGLDLDAAGQLSGLPASAGSFTFTVSATDLDGCLGQREYDVLVTGPPDAMVDAGIPSAPDAGVSSTDAGAPDGAAAPPDAATSAPDAAVSGAAPDAAAGPVTPAMESGGCATGRGPASGRELMLLVLLVLVWRGRRSRA